MNRQVVSVVAGRQHAVKAAEIHRASVRSQTRHYILDCGFYERPYAVETARQLGLPDPTYGVSPMLDRTSLQCGSKRLVTEIAALLRTMDTTQLIVYGDLLESVCAARAADATGVPLVHVEAGLRSFDDEDEEESYRREIDSLASLFVTHSTTALEILVNSGIPADKILLAASPTIATLRNHLHLAGKQFPISLRLNGTKYAVATIHRLGTLHDPGRLNNILGFLDKIASHIPVVLIGYGSTLNAMRYLGAKLSGAVTIVDTLDYLSYVSALVNAGVVITDSSGIQDEASYLGIPCFTLRASTHRFDTILCGTNTLLSGNLDAAAADLVMASLGDRRGAHQLPKHWFGPCGEPILAFLNECATEDAEYAE